MFYEYFDAVRSYMRIGPCVTLPPAPNESSFFLNISATILVDAELGLKTVNIKSASFGAYRNIAIDRVRT